MNGFKEFSQKSKDCMVSIDESKARKFNKFAELRANWIKLNQTHLSRVYPSGRRVDSSNFIPTISWSKGCQLVALNFQTSDAARRLNDGRFRENGNCGYVLKPESLRSSNTSPSLPLKLKLKVLCGTCLPKSRGDKKGEIIDPYVQVTLYDINDQGKDSISNQNTHSVANNGLNPIWLQDSPFRFHVFSPDIAMLQLTVWDKDVATYDKFIGSASIPTSCIREGLRSVRLFDANNKRNGAFECASLLVDVEVKRQTQKISMW